jgi:hypothetical protein
MAVGKIQETLLQELQEQVQLLLSKVEKIICQVNFLRLDPQYNSKN